MNKKQYTDTLTTKIMTLLFSVVLAGEISELLGYLYKKLL